MSILCLSLKRTSTQMMRTSQSEQGSFLILSQHPPPVSILCILGCLGRTRTSSQIMRTSQSEQGSFLILSQHPPPVSILCILGCLGRTRTSSQMMRTSQSEQGPFLILSQHPPRECRLSVLVWQGPSVKWWETHSLSQSPPTVSILSWSAKNFQSQMMRTS